MRRTTLALLAATLAAGCANPYRVTYSSSVPKAPKSEPLALLDHAGPPRLVTTNSMRDDAIRLLEEGYLPIGRSEFKSNNMYAASALEQAKLVGASVVVVKEEHVGSVTQSMPLREWIPDRRILTTETTRTRLADSREAVSETRETLTVIEGEYETHYLPVTSDTFEYVATFWKKARPPRFGVLVSEMDDSLRRRVGSNKGVLVKVVVRNSPAFLADFFRGDVIRKFAGKEVLGVESLFSLISRHAGEEVTVDLWRDGRSLRIPVELRK